MKEILITITILIMLFFLFAGDISFKPLSYKMEYPIYSIGWILILVGVILIRFEADQKAYKRGAKDGRDATIKVLKMVMEEENNKNNN